MDPFTMMLLAGTASSAISGISNFFGAKNAASAQTTAANNASNTQWNMFENILGNLQPFMNFGASNIPGYQGAINTAGGTFNNILTQLQTNPNFTTAPTPFTPPTAADAASVPGYAFMQDQGLKATQAGFAAQGLGSSGAAIKGAGQYATNLATTTIPQWLQLLQGFQQQSYTQQLGNRQYLLNALLQGIPGAQALVSNYAAPVATGLNAAGALSGYGQNTASSVAGNTLAAGNAQGASDVAQAGALGGIPQNAFNSLLQYQLINSLNKPNSTAAAASTPWSNPFTAATGGANAAGAYTPATNPTGLPSNVLTGSFWNNWGTTGA